MICFVIAAPALASDVVPPHAAPQIELADMGVDATHPMLRLTPDRSELVRLERNAASVIVGNPEHVNVLMDSARTLVLVPRTPGATHFTVLDSAGEVLMQRHVIVASPKQDYVRIRRSCLNAAAGCQETSVYYCPDMCHEVKIQKGGGNIPLMDMILTSDMPGMTDAPPDPGMEGTY